MGDKYRIHLFNCLELAEDPVIHDDVEPQIVFELFSVENQRYGLLAFDLKAALSEDMTEAGLVDAFQGTGPQLLVDRIGRVDDWLPMRSSSSETGANVFAAAWAFIRNLQPYEAKINAWCVLVSLVPWCLPQASDADVGIPDLHPGPRMELEGQNAL